MSYADQRKPGESFCGDCPDHEGCMTGYPCGLVKEVNQPECGAGTDWPFRHCRLAPGHPGQHWPFR